MNPTLIIFVIVVLGILFFASAVYALWWASRNGQFKKLEQGARVVFTAEEPEGTVTDTFPPSKKK